MAYLRLAHSANPAPTPDSRCLDAYARELNYIFATLRRLGARPHEIEDLAQDVFVVLRRNWSSLDTERPLRPYLVGVAFRIVSAHHRRWSREIPQTAPDAADFAINPEGLLESKESASLLQSAIDSLPLSRRVVIIMHELDEIPLADVARKLSLTRFGAWARLTKARKELAAAVRRLSKGELPR
jgi:RNA polymerase sigma-70 factor (ECF subfamily)